MFSDYTERDQDRNRTGSITPVKRRSARRRMRTIRTRPGRRPSPAVVRQYLLRCPRPLVSVSDSSASCTRQVVRSEPRVTARTRSVARRNTGPTEETHAGSPRWKDRTNVSAVGAWLIERKAVAGMTCRSMENVGPGWTRNRHEPPPGAEGLSPTVRAFRGV